MKIRKGWDDNSVNAVEVARICEANGASAVAVHGRTRMQQYQGHADWNIIREVKGGFKCVKAMGLLLEERNVAQVSINMTNFNKLIDGKLDPVLAFTTGKLKVEGDAGKALEFANLLKK